MNKVTMVDYGLGNVFSAAKALEACGAHVVLSDHPDVIRQADKLVLPGVGAFRQGMDALHERGLVGPIRDFARSQKPVLGICLGMQMLFDVGREFGDCEGLGLIPGSVDLIDGKESDGSPLRVPHVGWNALVPAVPDATAANPWEGILFAGLPATTAFVYFVHSYVARPSVAAHVLAHFRYGDQTLVAAVRSGAIWGCQFHPERSGQTGLHIIRNFVHL